MYVKNTEFKELYRAAQIDVILFNSEDIITTSVGLLDPDSSNNNGNTGSWTPPEW